MQKVLVETTLPFDYNGKGWFVSVMARDVRTFAETKHYDPSPELVLNLIGLVNEIMPGALARTITQRSPKPCAPALIVSGSGSTDVEKIKTNLERRYLVNIFLGLFARPNQIHATSNQANIANIGTPGDSRRHGPLAAGLGKRTTGVPAARTRPTR